MKQNEEKKGLKFSEDYLSEEELSQLKGGLRDKNKNSAYNCKCDNKPDVSMSNINSSIGCVCNCTPG